MLARFRNTAVEGYQNTVESIIEVIAFLLSNCIPAIQWSCTFSLGGDSVLSSSFCLAARPAKSYAVVKLLSRWYWTSQRPRSIRHWAIKQFSTTWSPPAVLSFCL
jgi:hypothetical protein